MGKGEGGGGRWKKRGATKKKKKKRKNEKKKQEKKMGTPRRSQVSEKVSKAILLFYHISVL